MPLEWPPPRRAALETVRHALLDRVGDNGEGQPRRRWPLDLDEWCRRRRRANAGARMRTAGRCSSGGTLECRERMGAKTADAVAGSGQGNPRMQEVGCEWTWGMREG